MVSMKTTVLYTFILLFSLTILSHCKSSSPEDTATGSEDNTAQTDDSQPKDKANPEPPTKISDLPTLLQLDPPMPLLQDILLEIPGHLNDSIMMFTRVYYECEHETEGVNLKPNLDFKLTEWYNRDIARSLDHGLCEVRKEYNKYIESETDRYHCRKELNKIISGHQEAGYECFITSLLAGTKNRLIKIYDKPTN